MFLTTHLDSCHDEKDSIWHGLFSQNCFDLNIYVVIERKGLTEGFVSEYCPVADRNVTSVISVQCYSEAIPHPSEIWDNIAGFLPYRLHILAHIPLYVLICFVCITVFVVVEAYGYACVESLIEAFTDPFQDALLLFFIKNIQR